ncbi:MAG: hypothetical protein ACTTJ6_02880 [Treponema sp.]
MGLLDKLKKIENSKKEDDLPRYFLFKLAFASFLKDVGAKRGAFLVKEGKYFHLAFPLDIDCEVFRSFSLDANVMLSIDRSQDAPFVFFDDASSDSQKFELLNTSLLYELDDLGCMFLLMEFEDRAKVLQDVRNELISKTENFKKEYEQNEILITTTIPPFPKYIGISSIESKMQGAVLASTSPNFLKFNFSLMFDFLSLHKDRDNLPLFYSMVNRISKMIGRSNFAILEKDFTLNACIFSTLPLDDAIYASTLKTVLCSIYGKDLIDKLEISFIKTLHDKHEKVSSWMSDNYNPIDGI